MKSFLLVLCLTVFIAGCSVTEPVRTLPQGKHQFSVSLGVQNTWSQSFTLPYFSLGYFNGITDGFTLGGNLYPLIFISGNIGFDVGGLFRIVRGNGAMPEISLGAKAYVFSFSGFH